MGLQSNQVPADMRETIYTKLGIKAPTPKPAKVSAQKREKAKKDSKQQQVIASNNEEDLLGALGGNEKLTLSQVFQSLDSGAQEQTSGLNANRVRSQLKSLNNEK